MIKAYKFLFMATIFAISMAACGGQSANSNSASNKPANSSANSTANTAANSSTSASNTVSTAPTLVTTIDNLQISADFEEAAETPGRIMKITGNLAIANDKSLTLSHGNSDTLGGNTVTCKGDFSKYTGLEDKISGLAKQNKAPKVVVEGKFSERINYDLVIEPCALTGLPN